MEDSYTGTVDYVAAREQALTERTNLATVHCAIELAIPMRDAKRRRESDESDKENCASNELRLSKVVPIVDEVCGVRPRLRVTRGGEFVTIESLRTELRIGCTAPPRVPQAVDGCAEVVANGVVGDWRLDDDIR